jgi:hypothetical protein
MAIYLYVKTHNITGLKYLGKTTQDPFVYKGSGKRWKAHIAKHGYNVTTEIIGVYQSNGDLAFVGKQLSEKWDIVNSSEWANLKPESGDGGACYWDGMNEHLKIVSARGREKIQLMKKIPWNKGKLLGSNHTKWWNNGMNDLKAIECPGDGWTLGRLFKERPDKAIAIIYNGVLYPSIKEAVRITGATKYSILKYGKSNSKQHQPFQQPTQVSVF